MFCLYGVGEAAAWSRPLHKSQNFREARLTRYQSAAAPRLIAACSTVCYEIKHEFNIKYKFAGAQSP
jgi:hypothetical protein